MFSDSFMIPNKKPIDKLIGIYNSSSSLNAFMLLLFHYTHTHTLKHVENDCVYDPPFFFKYVVLVHINGAHPYPLFSHG